MGNIKEFFLGCNYWASNAGTEMWREFDINVIREDLRVLSKNGVKYLRVFPNWRDFQPVEPLYKGSFEIAEYVFTDGRRPTNKYYLDEVMVERFREFCDICQEYGLKLIVGLLTGWMSGRMFVPTALIGKNMCTDPESLYFEQLYIEGLVEGLKDKPAIYAWDHGNECQCLSKHNSRIVSDVWSRMLSNAVYSHDRTRPLISGFNSLSTDGLWRFDSQAEVCDMLVTHPYSFWGRHTTNDKNTYIKTTLYPTAISKLYADLGKKPCLVEEFGTMGPSMCSEELAADILRVNYFSTLANGGFGILWWCANEQTALMTPPYTWTMVENELGMRYESGKPKPVLYEMKRLSKLGLDIDLPEANTDAVCLLTSGQNTWGVAFMTYVLAKQAGLNISFADATKEIPDAKAYMLPSIDGADILPKENYIRLKSKVAEGAKLYISQGTGVLSGFEELVGREIIDSKLVSTKGEMLLNGKLIPYEKTRVFDFENTRAEIIAEGLTKATYGKGVVYYLDFPAEGMLINKTLAFDNNVCELYKEIFKAEISSHAVKTDSENVALTIHEDGDKVYVIAVNHAEHAQKINLITDLELVKIHYGTNEITPALDAVIAEYKK